jgi:hypothetical protein
LLTAADVSSVGPAVVERLYAHGTEVSGPQAATLDECGASFASESLREARIQVAFLSPVSPNPSAQASNEVVRYRGNGAALAQRELANALRACPKTVTEGPTTFTALQVLPHDDRLLPNSLLAVQQAQSKAGATWIATSFQWDGDLFSGVYVYRSSRSAALRVDRALSLLAAQRLQSAGGTVT